MRLHRKQWEEEVIDWDKSHLEREFQVKFIISLINKLH